MGAPGPRVHSHNSGPGANVIFATHRRATSHCQMIACAPPLSIWRILMRVGVNILKVNNWVRALQSIPAWSGWLRFALYKAVITPTTDAERDRVISLLFHASEIFNPLLVDQGTNDPHVHRGVSDELVTCARNKGGQGLSELPRPIPERQTCARSYRFAKLTDFLRTGRANGFVRS